MTQTVRFVKQTRDLGGLEQNGTGSLVCPECGESDLLLKIDYGFDDVMFDLSKMEIANEKFFPVEGPRIIIREIFCSFCGHNVLSGNENLKHKRD